MKSKTKSKNVLNFGKNTIIKSLLNNVIFLYLIAIIALIELIYFLMNQKFSAIIFFYLTSLIIYLFNKNMIVVLGIPLITTFMIDKLFYSNIEGLENKDEKDTTEGDEKDTTSEEKDTTSEEKDTTSKEKDTTSDTKINTSGLLDMQKEAIEKMLSTDTAAVTNTMRNLSKNDKNKSGYSNLKLNPGQYTLPNTENLKKQLGEADKIEQAYDNLEKVIGTEGIQSMSNSTKDLVLQQKKLIEGLKQVTPVLNDAMTTLGKIDMSNLTNIFKAFK